MRLGKGSVTKKVGYIAAACNVAILDAGYKYSAAIGRRAETDLKETEAMAVQQQVPGRRLSSRLFEMHTMSSSLEPSPCGQASCLFSS